jgi:hypothetical protein
MLPQIKQKNTNSVFQIIDIKIPKTSVKHNITRPNNDPYIKKNNFLTEQNNLEIETNFNNKSFKTPENEIVNDDLYYDDLIDESNSDDETINLQKTKDFKLIKVENSSIPLNKAESPCVSGDKSTSACSIRNNATSPYKLITSRSHNKLLLNKINIDKPKNDVISDAITLALLILKLDFNEYNMMNFDELNKYCNKLLLSETPNEYNKIYLAFNILSNDKK